MAAVPPPFIDFALAAALKGAQALHREGRLADAAAAYRQILKTQPKQIDALQLLALIEAQNQRHVQAIALFDAVLKLRPDRVSAWVDRGLSMQALNRPEGALASYDRALALQPGQQFALFNRAVALQQQNPDRFEVLMQCAMTLMKLGHADEALRSYDRAVQLDPAHSEALRARAFALQQVGRHAEARDGYARARTLRPDHAQAQQDESLCALLLGDFAAGWPQYEWRLRQKRPVAPHRDLGAPRWQGTEDLTGRTILLHPEQGLGDTIQFCRYAQAVAALGAQVVVEVQAPLKALLSDVEGVHSIVARGEPLPRFDLHCPLLSLPLAFRTDLASIPAPPTLRAREPQLGAWKRRLGDDRRLRVGVVWSGNPFHINDLNRSIPLADFSRIVIGEATFFALQTELRDADRSVLQARPDIRFFGDELHDFSDTAALIDAMDLVITVDTSVAHLAGSMGKPVWVLLAANPDWRWMLDRDDSPWYPTARLFRQPAAGDWASVIDRVREALEVVVEQHAR